MQPQMARQHKFTVAYTIREGRNTQHKESILKLRNYIIFRTRILGCTSALILAPAKGFSLEPYKRRKKSKHDGAELCQAQGKLCFASLPLKKIFLEEH